MMIYITMITIIAIITKKGLNKYNKWNNIRQKEIKREQFFVKKRAEKTMILKYLDESIDKSDNEKQQYIYKNTHMHSYSAIKVIITAHILMNADLKGVEEYHANRITRILEERNLSKYSR